jgi:hypothetical protein
MDGAGPVVSMQSASPNLYSPKRPSDYAGHSHSIHFSSDDYLWETPKQEPTDLGNAGLNSIPPAFESVAGNNEYGYATDALPILQSSSGNLSESNGLGISYGPMEGYCGEPVSSVQAFPPLLASDSTHELQHNSEQQLDGLTAGLHYQHANDIDGNFSLAYTSGVDYNSSQEISSPPRIYVQPQYNDTCDVASTTISYTTSLQNKGEVLSDQTRTVKDAVGTVLQITSQSYSVQPGTPWDPETGGLPRQNALFFNNTAIAFEGSPFENSPLSSMDVTPLITQNMWTDEYSTEFVGDMPWPDLMAQQTSPIEDLNIAAGTGAHPVVDGKPPSLPSQYESLVSLVHVGLKRESESSPCSYQPKLDDLIGNFDSNPEPVSRKTKRMKFTPEGAEKVRSVRNKGACVACHYRKTPVLSPFYFLITLLISHSVQSMRYASTVSKPPKTILH